MDWAMVFVIGLGAIRFLEYLIFQTLLSALTTAIAVIGRSLVHAFAVILIMVMSFAFVGHLVLGYQVQDFQYLNLSIEYMLNLAWAVVVILPTGPDMMGTPGRTWLFLFKVLIVMIVMRMLLAIIITGYKDIQKKHTSETRGIDGDVAVLLKVSPSDGLWMCLRRLRGCCSCCKSDVEPLDPLTFYDMMNYYERLEQMASMKNFEDIKKSISAQSL